MLLSSIYDILIWQSVPLFILFKKIANFSKPEGKKATKECSSMLISTLTSRWRVIRYIGLGVRVGCLFLVRCLAIPLEKYSVAFPHAFFIFCPIGGKWVMVKLFSMKTIDSGAILKSYVDSHGISPKWLALQLNCHRTNLYKIFKKQHLDTFTILKFSEVLEHNFFEDIAEQYTNSQISTDSLPNE